MSQSLVSHPSCRPGFIPGFLHVEIQHPSVSLESTKY
ncbi:hypothetical protein GMORB2_6937 [Geosmithia morbida]|uniref:Uncharacterized protein n=1 Tax=Geosmithia morbida TaxID=1094350 RepID=A0A9P5D4B2_9HYPO|nr:uncharacterized protein GMORB2_6937 [Geosmithia morbida]KAF4122630.1 hypothetical protein GMORB2_6937 [Geosmithia morbida]